MEQKDFFMELEDAFDETNIEDLTLETNFRELDEWSSITALSLIASIDDAFGVTLSGDFIKSVSTLRDIFSEVQSKVK